jgi:hypothetical protein
LSTKNCGSSTVLTVTPFENADIPSPTLDLLTDRPYVQSPTKHKQFPHRRMPQLVARDMVLLSE